MTIFSLWLSILLAGHPVVAPAAKALVSLLESRYKSARTLQATFLERYSESGRVVRVESGIAYFRRPGKMRWEYEAPEKNVFLVDGKNAWFYVPADHTATRVPAKQSSDWRTPLALLAGEIKTSRICSEIGLAKSLAPESVNDAVLFCKLHGQDSQAQKACARDCNGQAENAAGTALLEIVKATGDLVRVQIRDAGGVEIEFHFKDWKTDPPLSDSVFHFAPPRGVAIVNTELPPGLTGVNP